MPKLFYSQKLFDCLFCIYFIVYICFNKKKEIMKIELYQIAIASIMPAIGLFAYLFTKLANFIEKKYDEYN